MDDEGARSEGGVIEERTERAQLSSVETRRVTTTERNAIEEGMRCDRRTNDETLGAHACLVLFVHELAITMAIALNGMQLILPIDSFNRWVDSCKLALGDRLKESKLTANDALYCWPLKVSVGSRTRPRSSSP